MHQSCSSNSRSFYNSSNNQNDLDNLQHYYSNQASFNAEEFEDFLQAARLGELSGIKSYLQKHYYVNARDSNGWTALMLAASYGHYNVIKSLLEYGADPNIKEQSCGRTALMMAASNGHTRCIEMLVQGKADIRLKDNTNCTAAYYATHYGHGSNKIIARLLRISGNTNNQYSNFNSNHSMSSSIANHKHQNTSHNLSLDSSTHNSERLNLLVNAYKNSLNEDDSSHQSFDTSSDHFSHNNERRFNSDSSTMSTNSMLLSPQQQAINDILKRNPQKPRPLFKQRTQRRLSPIPHTNPTHHQFLHDLSNSALSTSEKDNCLSSNSSVINGRQNNKSTNQNNNHSKQASYSFSGLNQIMANLEHQQSTGQSNCLRAQSLSLDLYSNRNQASPTDYSPDQKSFSSLQKNSPNYFQYDAVFESPQSSATENHSSSFGEKSPVSISKLESSFYSLDLSLNGQNDGNSSLVNNNSNNNSSNMQSKRNRPRNSTFASNNNSINENQSSNQMTSSGDSNSPSARLDERSSNMEMKFANLATNLNQFLEQVDLLDELGDLFAKQDIGLYCFLSMSADELKQIGIKNADHLASLIAGQLKFKDEIGTNVSLESMNFICYLGNKLEKVQKQLETIKREYEMNKLGLYDFK